MIIQYSKSISVIQTLFHYIIGLPKLKPCGGCSALEKHPSHANCDLSKVMNIYFQDRATKERN